MTVVAIIQARMSSSRLPGKILMPLAGKPVLKWMTDAASRIPGVDKVIVATSNEDDDDPVAEFCSNNQINCFRGSLNDVLSRMTEAARSVKAETVIRLTADCPLLDPYVCGMILELFKQTESQYTSNIEPPSWPDGLDCEVISMEALEETNRLAINQPDREHVTLYIRQSKNKFKSQNLRCPLPGLGCERWTLDTPADYEFLQAVASKLQNINESPSFIDILNILRKKPELREIQSNNQRNEALASPLKGDYQSKGYAKSSAMLERAEKHIPLGAQTFSKSRVQFPMGASPLFLANGNGGRSWDIDGNEYVDMVSGLLPNVLGYCDPDVDFAIKSQLDSGISFSLATELETQLAETLADIVPCAEMSRFGKNGTDATSGAVRIARAHTKKDHIIVMGYHGWQDWYIGSTPRHLGVPDAVRALTHSVPFNDLEGLHSCFKKLDGNVAAVILEPTGFEEPDKDFLHNVKELAHSNNALLVFDEIITGFRVHLGGAQSYYGVTPDLAAFGKSIANGMPLSVIAGKAEYMRLMEDIFFSGTFGGETLSLAAANTVIRKMQNAPVIETLWQTGQTLKGRINTLLTELQLNDIMELKGLAPWTIWKITDHPNATADAIRTRFISDMLANGVLIAASHNICYAHNDYDIEWTMRAYKKTLGRVKEELTSGELVSNLKMPMLTPVFQVRK